LCGRHCCNNRRPCASKIAAATTGRNVGFLSTSPRCINLSLGYRCEKVSHRTVRSGGKAMRGRQFFMRFLRDDRGATAIEYGLIVSLIVIAIIGAMEGVANENTGLWAVVRSTVTSVM